MYSSRIIIFRNCRYYIYYLCLGVKDGSHWGIPDHWQFHDQRYEVVLLLEVQQIKQQI